MDNQKGNLVQRLRTLRHITSARIGLGRSGAALSTADMLAFDLACAQARNAVATKLDVTRLLADLGLRTCISVHSAAASRDIYLRQPELGRQLAQDSVKLLTREEPDLVIVLGDGLSSAAVQHHAAPLTHEILKRLPDLRIAPLVVAEQARVALADHVGECMGARCAIMLIGERPGLSVHDSLGAYLSYAPMRGRTDAEKNCVSNIHGNGLNYLAAADQIVRLIRQAFRAQGSGVHLKTDGEVKERLNILGF